MKARYWHGLAGMIAGLIFGAMMVMGMQQRARDAYSPTEVLAIQQAVQTGKKVHIPVWIAGKIEQVQSQEAFVRFALAGEHNRLTARLVSDAPGFSLLRAGETVHLYGRIPDCDFNQADCVVDAKAIYPPGSWRKYFYMGGYGFYVWVSYGLALVVLVFNAIWPTARRREILKTLSRRRRQAERRPAPEA